ncbi:glycosyltransferase [bacterium]|nr:glycosyltransferase [bacterium]
MKEPLLSVIIPVYNRARYLESCLGSIFTSDYKDFEVIVVDDGSDDNSAEAAKKFDLKIIRHEENKGAGAARNTGSKEARGEILVFIDSDTTIYPDTLKRIKEDFENAPDIGVVQGIYSDFGDYTEITKFANLHNHFYGISNPDKYLGTLATYCVAIKKSVFEKVGMFEVDSNGRSMIGEDQLLGYRITYDGCKIYLDKDLRVDHHHPYTLPSYFKHTMECGRVEVHLMLRNSHDFLKKTLKTGKVGVLIPLKTIPSTILAFLILIFFLSAFIPFHRVISSGAFCIAVILFYALNSNFLLFVLKKKGWNFFMNNLGFIYIKLLASAFGCIKGIFEKLVLRKSV